MVQWGAWQCVSKSKPVHHTSEAFRTSSIDAMLVDGL